MCILDILTHLHTSYGTLEDEDVQAIDMELKPPIHGETNFEDFVSHIEDNKEAAEKKNHTQTKK